MKFSKFDKKAFNMAKQMAMQSDFDTFKLGAVVTYKHHVLGTGCNSQKTHPLQKVYNKKYRYHTYIDSGRCISDSAHAELAAITSIPYPVAQETDWSKVSIYVYRISPGRKHKFGLARPCPACMALIKDYGIRNIYYTGNDGSYIYEQLGWDEDGDN